MRAVGIVTPSGPYQTLKCSGLVHICHTISLGAARLRSITTASWAPGSSVIGFIGPLSRDELREVLGHAVQACLPNRAVLLSPACDLLEGRRVQGARSVLRPVTPCDQPRSFQHLDVLRDRWEREFERLGQLVAGRATLGETGQDRTAGSGAE